MIKKSLEEKIGNFILFIIVLFTVFSYESLPYLGYNITSIKNNSFNLKSQENKKNKNNISSQKLKCSQNTSIKATMFKKKTLIYQIKLEFNNPMKYTSSFLCPYKVLKIYWDTLFSFNIVIKTKKNINNLVLIINPPKYNLFFETRCNKKLPQQKIIIKEIQEKNKI